MSQDLLLNIHQTIPENLGSNQIVDTLDHFLYRALGGVIEHTPSFIDCRVANLLHTMGRDKTRRHYSTDHTNIVAHSRLLEYFAKGADKLNQIRLASLDRIFLYNWLERYVTTLKKILIPLPKPGPLKPFAITITGDTADLLVKENLSADMLLRARPALAAVKPDMDRSLATRDLIMQKFYRFVYKEILKTSQKSSMRINIDDLFQNTLMITVQTICKFSANKGTLTELIRIWFPSAFASQHDHFVDHAYLLPATQRHKMNDARWIDKSGARSTLAFDLEDAMHVQAGIDGQIDENESDITREKESLLTNIINACVEDSTVKQFAIYEGLAHTQAPPVNPIESVASNLERVVAMLNTPMEGIDLSGPVPSMDDIGLSIISGTTQINISRTKPVAVKPVMEDFISENIPQGDNQLNFSKDYYAKLLHNMGYVEAAKHYIPKPAPTMVRFVRRQH